MTKRNVVHVEISTRNHEESIKFYQNLFGWKTNHMPEMDYTTWDASMGPGGGFSPVGEMTRAGDVLVYFDSDDIEADLKKIQSLGGTVVSPKREIPNVGWFAVFRDPTGNTLALYTDMHPEAHN